MRISFRLRRTARSSVPAETPHLHQLNESLLSDSGKIKSDDFSTCALRSADVVAGVVGGVPLVGGYIGGMQSLVHQAQVRMPCSIHILLLT